MQTTEASSPLKHQPASSRTTQLVVGAVILALVSAAIGYLIGSQSSQAVKQQALSPNPQEELSQRQATVEANGAQVMPFDLSKTTHLFTDTPTGGVEAVTANDPKDNPQISLIRMHLQEEAVKFNKGDFSDPAAVHSKEMPGLAELEAGAGAGRITVIYRELPDGAQLIYTSSDQVMITALHHWFEAQRTDHGTGSHMNMNAPATPSAP